jgi:hypothetical protein|tara:strand:+ start:142 stop:375 length:234 start_codon:yes stop_codon:yes gene_type:complete
MKNKTEEKKKLNEFTPQTTERINMILQTISQMKEPGKTINEQTIKELDNLISELLVLRSSFVDNVINWTKQGYLVEE